jgi:precorrin-4 methylase
MYDFYFLGSLSSRLSLGMFGVTAPLNKVNIESYTHTKGHPPNLPVAIVERAGCADQQRTIVGTVSTIAHLAEKHHIQAPSTIIVGSVVRVLSANDVNDSSSECHEQEVRRGVAFHELLLPTLQIPT